MNRSGEMEQMTIGAADMVRLAMRRWYFVIGLPLLAAIGIAAYTVLQPRTYTATTWFMPHSSGSVQSPLAGFAAQFGVRIPASTDGGYSPEFYAELLNSETLLTQLVTEPRTLSGTAGRASYMELANVRGRSPEERQSRAVEHLRKRLGVRTSQRTPVVQLSVTSRWPDVSRQIAARALELINEFNLQVRQSQAAAERHFVDNRLAAAESELRSTENRLEAFLKRNRVWSNSPELSFEHDRLQREVALRQSVYTSLAEAVEDARIREVRNTPVITVVEPPRLPARPDRRGTVMKAALAAGLGLIVGVVLAAGLDLLGRALQQDREAFGRLGSVFGRAPRRQRTAAPVVAAGQPAIEP